MSQSHSKAELGVRPCSPNSKHNTLPETKAVLEREGPRSSKSQEGEKGCTRQPIFCQLPSCEKPHQYFPWIRIRDAPRGSRKKAREKSSTKLLQPPKLDPMMSPTLSTFSHINPEPTCHGHSAGMDRLRPLRV